MIYPNSDVIMYAPTQSAADDEMQQYGITGDMRERVTVVMPNDADYSVAFALPPETPWCTICDVYHENLVHLRMRFGSAVPVSEALAVLNDELAMRPERLRRHGTPG